MNIATFCTYLRVLAIPVFIAIYYSPWQWNHLAAATLFILACVTDWLDGYLARRLDQCTRFGAFLDPVADKLLVTCTLVLLAANYTSPWFVVPAAVMVAREVLISALREWMAENDQRESVAVSFTGKLKTTVQMLAIIVLLGSDPAGHIWGWGSGYVLLYVAAILTLWSMVSYLRSAWPVLTSEFR